MILGCAGPRLDADEARFFAAARPLGFILFARNCEDRDQVRALVAGLRQAVGRADAPVLIDQEGGRVARLRPPQWRAAPAAAQFGELARSDLAAAREAARINARLIAAELHALGVSVNCAPVLDVPAPGAHDVIGDRALAADPKVVAALGAEVCAGLLAGGVLPVIKHMPGHGRAICDSHLDVPVVEAPIEALREIDFAPFRELSDAPWGITSHVVYTALDALPATVSRNVIERVIRGEIGFGGLLVTDDISMQALSGGLDERTRAALAAGCDAVVHCTGDLDEMKEVADAAAPLSDAALERLAAAEARRTPPEPFDGDTAAARLDNLLAGG
jgi:beta-N-acetylhexosaminidase